MRSMEKVAGCVGVKRGIPDATPRKAVPFVHLRDHRHGGLNHLELRTLDRAVTTRIGFPVFEGATAWPPEALVLEGVEWMEVQAMKSRLSRATSRRSIGFLQRSGSRRRGKRRPRSRTRGIGRDAYVAAEPRRRFQGLTGRVGAGEASGDARRDGRHTRCASSKPSRKTEREARHRRGDAGGGSPPGFFRQRLDAMSILLKKWNQLAVAATCPRIQPSAVWHAG